MIFGRRRRWSLENVRSTFLSGPRDNFCGLWKNLTHCMFITTSLSLFLSFFYPYLSILFTHLSLSCPLSVSVCTSFYSLYLSLSLSFTLTFYFAQLHCLNRFSTSLSFFIFMPLSLSCPIASCLSLCLSVFLSLYLSPSSKSPSICSVSIFPILFELV